MANKIRIGDFGNRVAGPAPAARVPPGAFVQEDTLGEGLQRASGLALSQAKEEHNLRVTELRRAKSVEAYAGFQADVDELTAGLTEQLATKSVKRDDLPVLFDKGLADLKKARLDDLDTEQQASVGAHFMTAERTARGKVRRAMEVDIKGERVAAINGAIEEYQRLGVREPAKAIEQAGLLLDTEGPGVLGADKVAGRKQAFAEGVYATHFTERLNVARYDAKGLAALEGDVSANTVLDPDKKNVLLGRIGGFRETLAAKADRTEQARLRAIERAADEIQNKVILQGYDPSAQDLIDLQRVAKGTELEPRVRQIVVFANETAKYRAMPPRGQEAYENDLEGKIRKNPTPELIHFRERIRAIGANQRELARDDPISFAARQGADVQPLNLGTIDTLPDQLRARLSVSRGMQAQYGSPLNVLTREETATFADLMRRGTNEDKARMLGALKTGIGDQDAYMATMQQIAPDHPTAAWAGSLMGRKPYVQHNLIRADVAAEAERTARDMLRGESILNPSAADKKADGRAKPLPMPKDKDLLDAWNSEFGDAYRGRSDAFNVAWQSARALYAAATEDAGDTSGEFNAGRWEQSMRRSTGGVTDFNGAKVVRPYGMADGEFKDAVFKQLGTLGASGRVGIDKKMLARMQLESAGDAKYLVRGGTGYLLDKRGQPVVLDLFAQTLPPEGFKDERGRPVVEEIRRISAEGAKAK